MKERKRHKQESAVMAGLISVLVVALVYGNFEEKPPKKIEDDNNVNSCEIFPEVEKALRELESRNLYLASLRDDRGFIPPEPVVIPDQEFDLTVDQYLDLAACYDAYYQMIPKIEFKINQRSLIKLVDELVPQFEKQGFITTANYPVRAELRDYDIAAKHIGLLGSSNCTDRISINDRLQNQFSAWNMDDPESVFFTVVGHEIGHLQQSGLCPTGFILNVNEVTIAENSAQLMMYEVVSGLALQGNPIAARALFRELRDNARDSALAIALENNDLEGFKKKANLSPLEEARIDKLLRDVPRERIIDIYYRYARGPFRLFFSSLPNEFQRSDLLIQQEAINIGSSWNFVWVYEDRVAKFDDFAYFLENAQALAEGYRDAAAQDLR